MGGRVLSVGVEARRVKGGGSAMGWPGVSGDGMVLVLCGVVVLILLCTGVGAFVTSPRNWDVLSYHLPRQVYWAQQGHVGLLPTNDVRMPTMPPLAEYIGVQLMILSG